MTRSSRPRLRSEISRGHSPDQLSDGTSARTRPLSYEEIMCRRKSKKQADVAKEEARGTEHTEYEESVKNLDHHSKDANAAPMKHSNTYEQEADYRMKEDKSYKTEDALTSSKNKEVHDNQPKQKYEKDSRNGVDAVNDSRRGHLSVKLDDENQQMDSRYMHKHDKDVRNGSEVAKFDRGAHVSSRPYKEDDGNTRSKDKHENSVKNRTPMLTAGRRGDVRDHLDEEKHDLGSRSKYEREKHVKTVSELPQTLKRGHHSGRLDEERRDLSIGFKDKHEKIVRYEKPLKDDRRGSLRDKQDEETHARSKSKYEQETRNNSEGLRSNRHDLGRYKQGEVLRDTAPYYTNDKRHRDSVAQNRYVERGREASDVERKWKDRSVGDEKYRHKDAAMYDTDDKRHSVVQSRYIEKVRGALESERKRKDRSVGDEKYRLQETVKRRDSGHRLDSKLSERNERMELSRLQHDETRPKRRRSRSLDRSKDQSRRSRSASPKAQKNTLSHEHEHDHVPLPAHPQKERPSHNSDVDRSNTASNGLISHRRHSGFSSGLGGYSPRKRKTEAAIKTPSPVRSPGRKNAGWDPPSSENERNLNVSVAPGTQPLSLDISSNKIDLAIGTSVASSMGMPLSKIFLQGLSTFKEASVDSVQLTQATRPMRRLYIDNIPASASEKEIMESFNTHLLSSGSNHIRGTRPCISCMINKEKGQALLEFLTPEYASAALSFDGRSLYGSVLKIRRPKDYVEMTSGSVERLKTGADKNNATIDVTASDVRKEVAISEVVKDSPHKIFVGGIAEGLSSEMIMEIFSVLGPLKAFRFITNKDLNEPCVFLEYTDQSTTQKACAALNGIKLGGRILTVAQAIPDTSFKENLETPPFYGIPEHVKPLLEEPTLVLKLSNVLDQKAIELIPQIDLEDIMEDVRLECSRFGTVVSINVVTTDNMHSTDIKIKEVTDGELPLQSHGEREPCDHLNVKLDKGEGNGGRPLSDVELSNTVDNVEGDEHDMATAPANKVGEADTGVLHECDDVVSNDHQKSIGVDDSIIENTEITKDSDENNGVAGEDGGNAKLNDSETSEVDAVDQLDKASDKPQEVPSVSNGSATTSKVDAVEQLNNFEIGCILVEFKRTEASCMAAHCLHGRLFDDRTVTVKYVPHEAYLARFPK